MENQKGIASSLVIIIVIAIAVVAIGGILAYQYLGAPGEEAKVSEEEAKAEKEFIQELLAKTEEIGSMQYEAISVTSISDTTQPKTVTVTMEVWQKGNKMKIKYSGGIEEGGTTEIIHPGVVYFYDSSKDKYIKTYEEMATSSRLSSRMTLIYGQKSFEEISKELKESTDFKFLGTETINGKLCIVIEYSTIVKDILVTQKIWIWDEKGIPVKGIATFKTGEIIIIEIENKNFIFEDIPDSVFEVPEDKIIELSS